MIRPLSLVLVTLVTASCHNEVNVHANAGLAGPCPDEAPSPGTACGGPPSCTYHAEDCLAVVVCQEGVWLGTEECQAPPDCPDSSAAVAAGQPCAAIGQRCDGDMSWLECDGWVSQSICGADGLWQDDGVRYQSICTDACPDELPKHGDSCSVSGSCSYSVETECGPLEATAWCDHTKSWHVSPPSGCEL